MIFLSILFDRIIEYPIFKCSHPDCFWLFENDNDLKAHKLEHKLEVDANYTVEKKHVVRESR